MNSWYFVIWFSQHARSNLCSVVVAPCSCFCGGKPGKDWNSHLDFTVWEIFEKSMHSASQDAQVCLFTSTPSIDAWHVQSLAGIELSVATSRWQAVTLDQGLWRLILHDFAKYSILNSFLQMFHDLPLNILHIPSPDMLGDEIFPRNTAPSQPSHMLPRSSDRLMEPCLGAPVRMVMGWASIATRCYQLFDVNHIQPLNYQLLGFWPIWFQTDRCLLENHRVQVPKSLWFGQSKASVHGQAMDVCPRTFSEKNVMMDLKRAGNLSHQDSGATRLLQFSREWIVSSDGHFQSWHLQAAKTSPPTTETSVVEMLELGNLAEVSVLEIERNVATYGWHLRLKGQIWTGCGFHLKDLEGTYLLNMESCLQHHSRPKGVWNSRIELKTLWMPFLHKGLQFELGVPWWSSNPATLKENQTTFQ